MIELVLAIIKFVVAPLEGGPELMRTYGEFTFTFEILN
jgi:hypothetical protein